MINILSAIKRIHLDWIERRLERQIEARPSGQPRSKDSLEY